MTLTRNTEPLIASVLAALEANDLVFVTFRTKAGNNRLMGCTRKLSAVPEADHEGRFDYRLNHESIVCVYDFQNSAWRSFRRDSVVEFYIEP